MPALGAGMHVVVALHVERRGGRATGTSPVACFAGHDLARPMPGQGAVPMIRRRLKAGAERKSQMQMNSDGQR